MAGRASCPARAMPAAGVKGALLIEGRAMRLGLERAGNPPFVHAVRALEEAFGARFIRREWHEGTSDGRPTPFHLELSAPETGSVTLRLRQMAVEAGLAVLPDGHTTSHRVAIRIEKGVDVALAQALLTTTQHDKDDDDDDDDCALMVVITGNGDLEPAFEASAAARRTHVCGLRDGTAPTLRRWVCSPEGDRGLYLDDVLSRAWALAATDASPLHHHLLPPSSSSDMQHLADLASIAPNPARSTSPPPGLGGGPSIGFSWLDGGHRATTLLPSSSSSASSTPSLTGLRGANRADLVGEEELMMSGSGASHGSCSMESNSDASSGREAAARAVSPDDHLFLPTTGLALSSTTVIPTRPSTATATTTAGTSYASRLLLGVGSQQRHKGSISEASSSPSPAMTASARRSPEQQQRDDDGEAASTNGGREVKSKSRRRKPAKLRLKCFAGPLCTKLKDEEHLRRTTHPCQAGVRCPILLEPDSPEKQLHMERFLHPCPRGAACKITAPEHSACFEHPGRGVLPLCTKKGCRSTDHAGSPHRHLCPHGRNCSFLSHSVADKRVIRHTASFLHPCQWGDRCVAARAPGWNWEHMQQFLHDEQPLATTVPAKSGEQGASSGVGGSSNCSNDCSGGLAMGPEEVVAQLLLFQQQQKQKQQQVGAGGGGGDGGFGGSGPSASSFPALGGSGSLGDGMVGKGMGMVLGGGGLAQEAGALSSSNSSSFDGAVARHEGKEESEGEAEVGIFHQHRHYLLMQQQQQFFNGLLPPPGFLLQQLQRGGHEQPGPGRQPQAHGQEEPQGRVEEEDKGTDACLSAFERQVLASFSAAAAAAAALPKAPSSSPGPYDGIWKSNPSHNVPLTTVAGSHSVEGLAGSAMHYHGAF